MSVEALFEICARNKWRIGVAESCTGGGLGAKITSVSGSSRYFWGGIIAYSNDVKMGLLGVKASTIQTHGAVSEETAREMAQGVANTLGVELALSITGVAGPGAEGSKPEGRVCFGLSSPKGVLSFTREFGAIGRENVRSASVNAILEEAIKRFA